MNCYKCCRCRMFGKVRGFNGEWIPIRSVSDGKKYTRDVIRRYENGTIDKERMKKKLKSLRSLFILYARYTWWVYHNSEIRKANKYIRQLKKFEKKRLKGLQ